MSDTAPPAPSKRAPTTSTIIAGAVGLLVGIGGTLGVQAIGSPADAAPSSPAADSRLADAYSACGSPTGSELGDENRTLTIDVEGKDDFVGTSYEQQACILNELNVPSSVSSHLSQTTSMDGRQTESWDGITIAWSYHPDRGSDMVITLDPPTE